MWRAEPEGPASFGLALRATAVLLVLRAQGPPPVRVALIGIGVVALLLPAALTAPALWWAAAGLLAVRIASDWPLADNHIYLFAYWCLAVGLALGAVQPAVTLRQAGRWLLGAAFALAVVWKLALSPDFADGRFFRVTLLVDDRFEDLVRLVAGMPYAEIDRHRAALTPLGGGAVLAPDDTLVEPPALRRLALALTWGGVIAETALAVAFLAPLPERRRWLRHVLLLGFCVVTYPVAPVAGFGWLLLAVGLAQDTTGRWCGAYVAAWLIVLAGTELPWAGWLADAVGRA
jgi:hypothetical protein